MTDTSEALGDRFMLVPPDGGDVTVYNGARSAISALDAAEARADKGGGEAMNMTVAFILTLHAWAGGTVPSKVTPNTPHSSKSNCEASGRHLKLPSPQWRMQHDHETLALADY